jgi:membrane associated rhomboid family serine protease
MVIPLRDLNPTRARSIVVWVLMGLNVLVFVALQPHGGTTTLDANGFPVTADRDTAFTLRWAGIPCEIRSGEPLTYGEVLARQCEPHAQNTALDPAVAETEVFPGKLVWLAPFFALFLHGSIWHLGGNLLFLWVFGNNVEDRLGRWWFIVFYLAGGLVATAVQYAFTLASTTPVIGASGAIAALMGAYLVWWPRARILSSVPILLFAIIEIPAVIVLLLWFVMQFFTAPGAGIAWLAHVGGFVFGAAVAFALSKLRWRPDPGTLQPEIL